MKKNYIVLVLLTLLLNIGIVKAKSVNTNTNVTDTGGSSPTHGCSYNKSIGWYYGTGNLLTKSTIEFNIKIYVYNNEYAQISYQCLNGCNKLDGDKKWSYKVTPETYEYHEDNGSNEWATKKVYDWEFCPQIVDLNSLYVCKDIYGKEKFCVDKNGSGLFLNYNYSERTANLISDTLKKEDFNPGENDLIYDKIEDNNNIALNEEKIENKYYSQHNTELTIAQGVETNHIYLKEKDKYIDITESSFFHNVYGTTANRFPKYGFLYVEDGQYYFGAICVIDMYFNGEKKSYYANYATNGFGSCEDIKAVELKCNEILGNPEIKKTPAWYMQIVFDIMKYIAIVILIVLTIMDFMGAVASQDDNKLKESLRKGIVRLVCCIVIFILPTLIKFILTFLDIYSPSTCGIK